MGFWSFLFGKSNKETSTGEPEAKTVFHEGFAIKPTPIKEGGHYRVCGEISREIDGNLEMQRFIRADVYGDLETTKEATILKAKRLIDEQLQSKQ